MIGWSDPPLKCLIRLPLCLLNFNREDDRRLFQLILLCLMFPLHEKFSLFRSNCPTNAYALVTASLGTVKFNLFYGIGSTCTLDDHLRYSDWKVVPWRMSKSEDEQGITGRPWWACINGNLLPKSGWHKAQNLRQYFWAEQLVYALSNSSRLQRRPSSTVL